MTTEDTREHYYKQEKSLAPHFSYLQERKDLLSRDDVLKIHNQAQIYGGSFEKAITVALIRADRDNQLKLQSQFMDIFNKFLEI